MNDRERAIAAVGVGVSATLSYRVLGPVRVDDQSGRPVDIGGSKPRLVLARLLLDAGRVVSTESLIDAVWGDDPPPTARRSLQSHLARLRAVLGGDDGPIRPRPPGYVVDIEPDSLDLARCEATLDQARQVLAADPRRALVLAERARDEWSGEPLADLTDHGWVEAQRQRLGALRLGVIEVELDAGLSLGRNDSVIERLEALLAERHDHEPYWSRLMIALYRAGRQRESLEAFRRARIALAESVGLEPSPELQRLEADILRQSSELEAPVVATCPYKGLASYQVDDADMFCGRERVVDELAAAVRSSSFVVVVGGSGTGKSSALRAGLARRIDQRGIAGLSTWAVINPGLSPLRSYYQVPASVDLVIVDQFEELFTSTDDPTVREQFVSLLVERASSSGHVVISLRSDFFAQCAAMPRLAPMLARRQVVVSGMSTDELRAAVVGPAERAGLTVAPELVDRVVDDAAGGAGVLPLVSHALAETWRRRTSNELSLEDYAAIGSMGGAIARSAEDVYAALEPRQREQTRHLFLRLVENDGAVGSVRRLVPHDQIAGSSVEQVVIERFVDARLQIDRRRRGQANAPCQPPVACAARDQRGRCRRRCSGGSRRDRPGARGPTAT